MKLDLSATESLLVISQNRIDVLTGEQIAGLREAVATLQAEIEAVRLRESKLQQASAQAWDQILEAIGDAHSTSIPSSARMEADGDSVSIEWEVEETEGEEAEGELQDEAVDSGGGSGGAGGYDGQIVSLVYAPETEVLAQ